MSRFIPACLALTLTVGIAACGESVTGVPDCSGECINIGLQNSSSESMTIEISKTGAGSFSFSVTAAVGYSSLEVPGQQGDVITFRATQGTNEATGSCVASLAITTTSEYGQVNFVSGGGAILIECASGWQ